MRREERLEPGFLLTTRPGLELEPEEPLYGAEKIFPIVFPNLHRVPLKLLLHKLARKKYITLTQKVLVYTRILPLLCFPNWGYHLFWRVLNEVGIFAKILFPIFK